MYIDYKDDGCPMCKETKEKFIKRSKICHGNKYDYSRIRIHNRVGTDKKSRIFVDDIVCPEHGKFSTRSDSWKIGCPKCAGRNLDDNDIIKKAEKMYGNRYNYDDALIMSEFFSKCCINIDPRNTDDNEDYNEDNEDELWDRCAEEEEVAKSEGKKIKMYIYILCLL